MRTILHAAAFINWTAEKEDRRLEGGEFAVFKVEKMRFKVFPAVETSRELKNVPILDSVG